MDLCENNLKNIILNSEEPVVFKKFLKNEILQWNLNEWNHILENEELEFRSGQNAFSKVKTRFMNKILLISCFDHLL